MRRILTVSVVLCVIFFGASVARAHLCNDVFAQAKDNLAVKVDIRDGQLRIGKSASFRVYLLNTMDRDIVDIRLEVLSNQFNTTVTPAPDWQRFPYLKAKRTGGRKEYFTVRLDRKPRVPDGKYDISLRLFNGQNRRQSFKSVNLNSAAGVCGLPKATAIAIDGAADANEWRNAFLCSDFYEYQRAGPYYENRPARQQTRVRVTADADHLYCLFTMQGGNAAQSDRAAIFVAPASDAKPVKVTIDRMSGSVECEKGREGIEVRSDANSAAMECKIPRKLLGIENVPTFYGNFTRTLTANGKETVSFWRGNTYSELDPIVYGVFALAE